MKKLLIILVTLPLLACAQHNNDQNKTTVAESVDSTINSYKDCVKAGYPIMRSLPPKCRAKDGRIFVKGKADQGKTRLCKDRCGDGACQEITCLGENCPCHESHANCPSDCQSNP